MDKPGSPRCKSTASSAGATFGWNTETIFWFAPSVASH